MRSSALMLLTQREAEDEEETSRLLPDLQGEGSAGGDEWDRTLAELAQQFAGSITRWSSGCGARSSMRRSISRPTKMPSTRYASST